MASQNPIKSDSLTPLAIKQLFKKARRILKSPGLDLLIAPLSGAKTKLIVVTPGYIGNAVQRNTIRRRVKALFQEFHLSKSGFLYIVFIKKEGISLSYDQIKALMLDTLNSQNT